MSTPLASDDLFKLIRKSGLIAEQKLTAFLAAHQRDGLVREDSRKIIIEMVREGLITNFQGEQFLLGKWRGFTLGKFKLLERIGVGGMGQVFLCEHTFMRKRLAVKVLPPSKAEDPVSLGRFYREARVASRLEHPNVVRTFDIDQDGPLHFLVMEYVDGTSLLEVVKKFGPLNVVRACHYIRQACMGLQYAYASGMIHRDIKPGNIMVDRGGSAKLLDMGLARFHADEKDQLTLKYDDKNVLGTADYVAPEQTLDSRNIDIRADIYGMGATFYYVLAGQPPFPEPTVAEKLIAHQTKKPRPVRELRPEVPAGVAKIIERMMAKDPKDRFQTPGEVVTALDVWTQQPIDPPPEAEMPKLSPAAMDPSFTPVKPAAAPAGERDGTHVRPDEAMPHRSVSSPVIQIPDLSSDFEDGKTVPAPHTFRPSAPAASAGSKADLVVPAPLRPAAPAPKPASGQGETRPLMPSSAPTPPPGSMRPPSPPGAPGHGGVRPPSSPSTSTITLGGDVPGRPAGAPPRPAAPRPSDHGTKGKSVLPALRPSAHGAGKPPPAAPVPPAAMPRPSSVPAMELPKLRSLHGISVTGDASPAPAIPSRPPIESLRIQMPQPPRPPAAPAVTASRAPAFQPVALQPPRLAAPPPAPAFAPAYKAPTLMPFFDQPIVPSQPGLFTRLVRWLMMIVVSSVIGAALGAGVWYQFLRQP